MPQLACAPFVTMDDVLASACACDLNEDDHGDLILEAIDDASDVLYVLSAGRVYGRCTRTVWPVRTERACHPATVWHQNRLWPEGWVDWDSIDSIPLVGPETNIIEITIDGAVVPPSEYGLVDGYKLFRRTGSWPDHNDITKADTEVGTFTIRYSFGRDITGIARRAIIEVVCMFVNGDVATINRLRGVRSANLQGVSVTVDQDEIRSMGLPEVARFMDVYGASGRGTVGVYSPELNHGWRLLSVAGPNGS